MESLFEAVRAACSPAQWSRGVELARVDAVLGERTDGDEVVVRVATRGGLISRGVRLFLDEDSWECSCGAPACEHAAAAVIAVRRSRDEGRELPAPRSAIGRVVYRLRRVPGGLSLERGVEVAGSFTPLEVTIAAASARRDVVPEFHPSQADLAAELALGTLRKGVLPRGLLPRLLGALSSCGTVTLDGVPVRTSSTPVLPRVAVEEEGPGYRLVLEQDPEVTERLVGGVALCGDVLRPVGEPGLTAREVEDLSRGARFPPSASTELVTAVLPSLGRRLPLDVRTSRLPRTARLRPRVVVDLERDGERLTALPTLVYGDPPMARIDGGKLVHFRGEIPLRDEGAERVLVRALAAELGVAPGIPAVFEGEAAVDFVSRLDRWRGEARGAGREHFRVMAPLIPRVEARSERFDVVFESAGKTGESPRHAVATDVLAAWRRGVLLVPLLEGGFASVPAEWLARHGDLVADLLAARDATGGLPRAALPDLGRLCRDLDQPPPPNLGSLEPLFRGFDGLPAAALPEDLTATLRPYQRRGVDWLCFLRDAGLGALLADDMGLGKTLQSLCALRGRALVVAPTSVLPNWVDEIRRFRPALRASVYHGPRRALDPDVDVTVTSYALLRLDEEILAAVPWDTVVLDEAQTIKNPDSQVAAAAYRLTAGFRVALSGTPVENRLDELWSQLHFANPGLLGGRRDFDDRYASPIAEGSAEAAGRLRSRIAPFVLRRLKREVATDLPARTDSVLYCELALEERRVYDAVRAATRDDVVRRLESGGSVLAALEALLRLRQAACHPALVPGQSAESSSKVELLLESLETVLAEGHKALVFSQWTSFLDLVEPHLARAGIGRVRLDGSTANRSGVVASFQEAGGPPILLVSLRAGGTGLNLTAADHVFLLDPWWNPAVEDQAADRTHRIGQDRPVFVYRLVAEETVEERILALQARKREVAEAALGAGAGAASLTRDDLLALLE